MLKVLELFGGIGACTKALKRLGIDAQTVDYVEIDNYAVKSYNAVNGTNFTPQDITKWDKNISVDLIMHGSPCQDFSVSGLGKGGDEGSGTRSSLMYETIRIVEKLKPKYVVWENVKNVISKKHKHNFDNYINRLEELGYKSFYKVCNAKNYGIPQNRERVFTVSILGGGEFVFPEEIPLSLRLKDMLETEVDEKYFLSEKTIAGYDNHKMRNAAKGNGFGWNPTDGNGVAFALQTTPGKSNANYVKCDEVGSLNHYHNDQMNRPGKKRGCVQKQMIQTLKAPPSDLGVVVNEPKIVEDFYKNRDERVYEETAPTLRGERFGLKVVDKLRIRKLTPLECWRLMGFDDFDFHKAELVNSNTQLYKQAGNSIVVNVLEAIFKNLLVEEVEKVEIVNQTVEVETDKMIDLISLLQKEPELFEELAHDYPVNKNTTYVYKVV